MIKREEILDIIVNSDCFCTPGDPTCADWTSSEHRWEAICDGVMRIIDKHNTPKQSNLVDHARRELELIGEDPDFITGYLKVIQAFADMDHSGGSASIAIPVINRLLQFGNLSDLTNNPDEWLYVSEEQWGSPEGIWQSRRNSEAFSNDAGNSYYLLSEGGNDKNRHPIHQSKKVV